jgi:hypothetical protein
MGSFLWRSSQQQQKQAFAAAPHSPAAATKGEPWALGLSQQRLDDLKAGNQGEVH